jgi:hypothetical protein
MYQRLLAALWQICYRMSKEIGKAITDLLKVSKVVSNPLAYSPEAIDNSQIAYTILGRGLLKSSDHIAEGIDYPLERSQ